MEEFIRSMREVQWAWMLPCAALSVIAYLLVAWEWQLMLRLIGPVSFWRTSQAVFAGRFVNDTMPLHAGYIVRIVLASRWLRVGLAAMAPSLIMERLGDGLWLALGAGALSLAMPLPANVIRARNGLFCTVLGGAALTAVVMIFRHRTPPIIKKIAEGTREIVHSHLLSVVIILSFVKLAVQAAAVLIMLPACGIKLSMADGLAVFMASYLATCVPSTPASTGLFQLFVVTVLEFLGVGKAQAAGFSLISFVTLTVPVATAGFFAFSQSGMTFRQIRQEAATWK